MGSEEQNAQSAGVTWLRWPARVLGPRPGLREINMICWGLLAGVFLARFAIPFLIQLRSGGGINSLLPADFIYFYGIGHIANTYPLERVYDYTLQLTTFNQIYALHDQAYGPSPYPPFVALFFSAFARMPFAWAFALWAVASLVLYLAGIRAVVKAVYPGEPLKASLIFSCALAFYPFVIGTLANGQLASIAVFSVGMAIAQESKSRRFSSGLALSILAYKPTLLVLIIPMLLLTRRFKALGGFVSGALMLALVSTAFGGIEVWTAYARFLSLIGRVAGPSGQASLPLWKYVDLDSCIHAISGGKGAPILPIAIIAIAIPLAVLWWRSAGAARPAQNMAWAATLIWTMLLNVYVPIYDAVLATLAVVLTLGALKEMKQSAAANWIVALSVLILAASWETSAIAGKHGVQVLSILLAVLGLAQLYLMHCSIGQVMPIDKQEGVTI